MSRFLPSFLLGLLLFSSCTEVESNARTGQTAQNSEESSGPQVEKIFRLLSAEESGIDFQNNINETQEYNYFRFQYTYNGAGVAIADINNDGLRDIYLTGNQVPDRLYLNKGNLHFEDISTKAGINNSGGFNFGVTAVDINSDGFQDFYICRSGHKDLNRERANLLYVNQGNGTFKELARSYGLDDTGHSLQSAFFDYDNDGDLDVYLTNHPIDFGQNLKERMTKMKSPDAWEMDRLYQNNGNGSFSDVTAEAGLVNYGHGLGLVIFDINEDGWDDIYVANDYQSADFVYVNQKDGSFKDVMKTQFPHIPYYSMGVDVADLNNDGLMDLNVVEMLPENYKRRLLNLSSLTEKNYYIFQDVGFHHQYLRNGLMMNTGMEFFSDVAPMTGTEATDWSWATLLADFDNDGRQDILVTNGYLRDMQDKDYIKKAKIIKGQGTRMTRSQFDSICVSTKIRNYLYRNTGELQFDEIAKESGLSEKSFSSGAAYGDLDNDGDLDLVINNVNLQLQPDPAFVYENLSANGKNHISLALEGPEKNPSGVGVRAILDMGDEQQFREARRTRGFLSAVEDRLHFGIEEGSEPKKLTVIWPDGKFEVLDSISAGDDLVATYTRASGNYTAEKVEPLFAETLVNGLNFKHDDKILNEYDLEPQLPFRLGMQGPGACIGDVNGDGLDDLFITATHDHEDKLFVQTSIGMRPVDGPWAAFSSEEHIEAQFVDVDQDGDLDLFVGSGGIERGATSPEYLDRIFINNGSGEFSYDESRLPRMLSSTSCARFGDIDADGDLDLFIGSRSVPGRYGERPKSYLLQNIDGKFTIAQNSSAILANVGMVSDAEFFDMGNDGDQDLIIVGEWMKPVLLENRNGAFSGIPSSSVPDIHGLWRSVHCADLDGDGESEIILGNSGTNIKYNADQESPLLMYTGDLGGKKNRDIMIAYKQGKYYHPDRSFLSLHEQFPFLKSKYPFGADIAGKSLEQIFGDKLAKAKEHKVNELNSLILDLQGDHYEAKTLPALAQVSYVNDIQSVDLDSDGDLDLIIGGNELYTPIQTGSSDASIGAILINDGQGNFSSLHPRVAGLRMDKWVKGFDFIEISGEKILFVWRNDEEPICFKLN